MNCKQCGAPLSVDEDQDLFHCQYCGSYDFPNPNQDGVALIGELSSSTCPLCEQSLVSAVVQKIRILSCPHCRGNLVAQSKMLPILRQAKPTASIGNDVPNLPNKAELKRTAACPSCRKRMAVYQYGGPGNIIIQGCEHCQVIWLDFGELSRIVQSYAEMYNQPQDELGAKKKGVAF